MIQHFLDFLMEFGALGLFIHAFIDAVIFPIPALFLQIPLSLVNPSNALWLATVGFIGCLLGTPVGYWIGRSLGNAVLYKILKKAGSNPRPSCSNETAKPPYCLAPSPRSHSKYLQYCPAR